MPNDYIDKVKIDANTTVDIKDTVSGYIPSPSGASSGEFLKYNGASWVADVVPGGASPSDTTPSAPTASGSAGTAATYSRGDHAHPKEIFIATYGITTAAQLSTALLAEKLIVAIRTSTNRLAVLYRGDPIMSQFWFSFIDVYGKVEEWYCDTSGWTRDTTDLVPTTRTINGNALSSNITLDADDVGALASDGIAQRSRRLQEVDSRNVNDTPNDLISNTGMGVFSDFKTTTVISTGETPTKAYYQVISCVPWINDSGGLPVQIALANKAGVPLMYARSASSTSAWGSWNKLATISDIESAIGAAISGSY